jgi:hypothetical protein
MTKLRWGLLAGAALVIMIPAAIAIAGSGTITVKDASGSTQTYDVVTDGSGFYLSKAVVCDATAGANCGAVKAASTAAGATDPAQVVAISPNNTILTQGAAASGASVSGNPLYQGARAQSAEQTAVTSGQAIGVAADLTGKQITLPYANPENSLNGQITSAMTGTSTTAVTGMGAQGAGVRVYVTSCTFSNSHATVGTMILLQDGSGGTTIWQAPAAAVYGGATVNFPTPIKTTANTALFAANVTTGANTFVSCTGFKGI